MHNLSIDIETYSSVDLPACGLYKYVQSPDFEILLFAYSFDDEPVVVLDLTEPGRGLPERVVNALRDPAIQKSAYNAAFEWYCLNKFWASPLDQWQCTMVHGLYAGYPAGLGRVALAMGFPEDKQKDRQGTMLIKKFCCPRKPTKNKPYTRTLPEHEPEQWGLFKSYCQQDVVVEKAIKKRLDAYPLPETEQKLWIMDMAINSAGVAIDRDLVDGAIAIDTEMTGELMAKMRGITGLDNPNSPAQLKKWIEDTTGITIASLSKDTMPELINAFNDRKNLDAAKALAIRQELAKTSIKKYYAMADACCADGRVRGLLQFYGTHTGRWAGRLVQVQNLPRNYIDTLDNARGLVKQHNTEALKVIYGNVPDTVSQLIRTAFVAGPGNTFAVADYSAIEARVIAWISGEDWRMDVFKTHGKIYEASASAMFGVPIDKIAKGNPEYALRAKGKVAELALGYQGSVGALKKMGALKMGLAEDELPEIVSRWRESNKHIRALWYSVESAALNCVEYAQPVTINQGITFSRDENYLFITLPSGRRLFYPGPVIVPGDMGHNQVEFEGLNQTTHKWELIPTYGGKLVENIVQAVARDCLAYAMYQLYAAGYQIRFHIHDEVILEIPEDDTVFNLDNAIRIMCTPPSWAQDLPLNADGFTSRYYKKD